MPLHKKCKMLIFLMQYFCDCGKYETEEIFNTTANGGLAFFVSYTFVENNHEKAHIFTGFSSNYVV